MNRISNLDQTPVTHPYNFNTVSLGQSQGKLPSNYALNDSGQTNHSHWIIVANNQGEVINQLLERIAVLEAKTPEGLPPPPAKKRKELNPQKATDTTKG